MKNLKNLGQALSKAEQQSINGGRLVFGPDNWPGSNGGCNPQSQCLSNSGRCTHTMTCMCADETMNHFSCDRN